MSITRPVPPTHPLVRVECQDGVLVVTVDNPPVNALSHAVRVALIDVVDRAQTDDAVAALVLRCEGPSFIAGADIKEFANPRNPRVPEMVEWVEASRKPIVAAVQGAALGGGLELIMACHYRIASSSASFGLPEVKIGLLPGAGGTQRLPRLVGFECALKVIVDGETLDAEAARVAGLVDRVTHGDVDADAIAYAHELVTQGAGPRRTSERQIDRPDAALLERYREQVRREYPGFLAPLECIDSLEAAALPFTVGSTREKTLFFGLFGSRQAKACQYIFFAQREVGRLPVKGNLGRSATDIVLVGSGPLSDRLAAALSGSSVTPNRMTEEQWTGLSRDALAKIMANDPWFIDATDDEPDCRARMLSQASRAGATFLSTTAPSTDLARLTSALAANSFLTWLGPPVRHGAKLVETRCGPQGVEALEPVHHALRRASAVPLFLPGSGESLQARLLAGACSHLQRLQNGGVSASALAGALSDFGLHPALFGLYAGNETETSEERRSLMGQLEDSVSEEAKSLVSSGHFTAPQIDIAWTLGLGWPIHRNPPAWRAASANAPPQ